MVVEKVEVEVDFAVGETTAVEVVSVRAVVLVVKKVEVGPLDLLACNNNSWRSSLPVRQRCSCRESGG